MGQRGGGAPGLWSRFGAHMPTCLSMLIQSSADRVEPHTPPSNAKAGPSDASARDILGAPILPKEVAGNAVRDPDRRFPHRVLRQMRIPRRRFHLRVTEQPADHGQGFAERQRPGSVAVSAVMKPHVLQPGALADDVPGVVEVPHRLAPDLPRDHERIVGKPGNPRQDRRSLRRQRNRPGARLRVG